MKSKILINGNDYFIEIFINYIFENDCYRFSFQITSSKNKSYSIPNFYLSQEFIENEINNDKDLDYLNKIALKVVINHFNDINLSNPNKIKKSIESWFIEAKQQINKSSNE